MSQQEESKQKHIAMAHKETRRKGAVFYDPALNEAEKFFQLTLESEKLGLKGVLDCLIRTGDGEYIPVDYKYQLSDHGRMHLHHKYQLVGYSLLADESFQTTVRRAHFSDILAFSMQASTLPISENLSIIFVCNAFSMLCFSSAMFLVVVFDSKNFHILDNLTRLRFGFIAAPYFSKQA